MFGGPDALAPGNLGDVGKGVRIENLTHESAGLAPHGKKDALPFVVTRSVLVWFAEVAEADRAVHRPDYRANGDVARIVSQDISTANASLGFDKTGTLERKQDLFEVGLWQSGSFCDVTNRSRPTRFDM